MMDSRGWPLAYAPRSAEGLCTDEEQYMIGRRMVAASAVIAAVAAGGIAGAIIGIPGSSGASTASSSSTTTSMPKSGDAHAHGFRGGFGPAVGADKGVLDAAAKALKLSTKDLLTKLSDGKTTIADIAGQQGVSVNDVISAMEAVSNTDITNMVNNPFPAPPTFKGGPKGPGGFGPTAGFGLGFGGGDSFATIAKALGITTQDLMTDLRNGQSIAAIAKTKSVDVTNLVNTLVTDATSKLNDAVKNKHLSQDMATKLEAHLKDMITAMVNGTGPKGFGGGGFGGFGHFGRHGHGGKGGPGGKSSSSSTTTTAVS